MSNDDATPVDEFVTFDVDAAMAARREKVKIRPKVRIGGHVWTFQPLCPLDVLETLNAGNFRGALRQLLADTDDEQDLDAFNEVAGQMDQQAVLDLLAQVYGVGPTG